MQGPLQAECLKAECLKAEWAQWAVVHRSLDRGPWQSVLVVSMAVRAGLDVERLRFYRWLAIQRKISG